MNYLLNEAVDELPAKRSSGYITGLLNEAVDELPVK